MFPGVSREVMFHSFLKTKDGPWVASEIFFFNFFLIFALRRIWKVSRGSLATSSSYRVQSHDRSVPFSSHQKMFITRSLRHPGGELLGPRHLRSHPRISSILRELKILEYPDKIQFWRGSFV